MLFRDKLLVIAAGCVLVSSAPTVLTLTEAKDFILSGGAQVYSNPILNIRSGKPNTKSIAAIADALQPGAVVTSLSFSYRYCFGYAKTGVGSNFTLKLGSSAAYYSPHFTDYPYNKGTDPDKVYSPPVNVTADKLSITVPKSGVSRIEFDFENVDRNVQLLLPMTITITCAGGSCLKPSTSPLLPLFIDSNMVLQREPERAALWGSTAAAGETITVVLSTASNSAPNTWTTTASANGSWAIDMDPQPASTGATIKVSGSSGRTQTLKNVAFGDVVLCSGQSNMAFSTNLAFNASAEIADSIHYPGLRFFTAANVAASTPQTDCKDFQSGNANSTLVGPYADSSWAVSSPAAFVPAGGPTFSWPSAVCYFYGRDVYKSLGGKVPIGLLGSDWGGQPIEPFMSPDALNDKTCGGTKSTQHLNEQRDEQHDEQHDGHGEQHDEQHDEHGEQREHLGGDSSIWNGMIAPLTKMRFASILWYQGESNAKAGLKYSCSFPAMVADWRLKFNSPKLPFYFVVLAPCDGSKWCDNFVNVRNAQFSALQLPHTGYAVAVDLGDVGSPARSVHPRRKQEVGRRLALQALDMQYGQKIVSTGPVLAAVAAAAEDSASIQVSYTSGTADGLHSSGTGDCNLVGSKLCCGESPFEVMDSKSKWIRTNFTISGSTVSLQMPAGANAATAAVRYAWQQWPQCSLYNGKGGPDNHTGIAATPFCWNGTAPCPVN